MNEIKAEINSVDTEDIRSIDTRYVGTVDINTIINIII